MKALLGKKVGMTQILTEEGALIPVTLLHVGSNVVTKVKHAEKDGYTAVAIGYGEAKHTNKPQVAELKKNKVEVNPAFIKEIRVEEVPEEVAVGGSFNADVFEVGDIVHVTGVTKGKGWAGTIKRHNFKRQRKTHGAKGFTRRPGSIGSMYPQKIFKGKRMAGRMGGDQQTTRNLTVALVDVENQVIGIKGAVPGPNKAFVKIRGAN